MSTPRSTTSTSTRTSWVEDRLAEVATMRALGDPDALASLLARHPEWDDDRAIRLIYEDLCARRDRGEEVASREALALFPQYRDELATVLGFDRLVRANARGVEFPEVGDRLGPFTLVDELGRGASGRAYLATECGLADRLVVLKLQPLDQDEHLALAQLQNTHIIPIFSEHAFAGRGLRALCMPYLGGACLDRVLEGTAAIPLKARRGKDLLDAIDRLRPAAVGRVDFDAPCRVHLGGEDWTRAACWIAACLADALHSAHARGLIHMDVKPSNVLIAEDGLPLLLDFHLARRPIRVGENIEGRMGGTTGWMAPEQREAFDAAGRVEPSPSRVDGRCDIHAIGLILSVMLDGGQEPREGTWTPRDAAISPGLVAIVRKCLAADPSARYATAAALADDLRRHLDDLPLSGVRNRSLRERWAKWRRRRPGSLGRILVASVAIATLISGLAILGADHARRLADADDAMSAGRALMARRQHAEAVSVYARGLGRVEGRFSGGRSELLREELGRAKLGRRADDLHRLAESLRFRFGIEPPDAPAARALERALPPIWRDRDSLLDWASRSGDPAMRDRVRTDLLELAILSAEARAGAAIDERRSALTLLEEAGVTCGRSRSWRRQVREIRASLGLQVEPDDDDDSPPADAWDRYDLGRSYLRASRFAEARDAFEAASRERPQDFWPCFYQGVCAFRLARYEEAAEAFRVCEAIAPASAECPFNQALAQEALGRPELARSLYSRALAIDRALAPARLNRGILSFRRGDIDDAIADYDEALRTADDPALRRQAEVSRRIALRRIGR